MRRTVLCLVTLVMTGGQMCGSALTTTGGDTASMLSRL